MYAFRHNILLDAALQPHLADFGFLMALPIEHRSSCLVTSTGSIALAGTRGYLAPEFITGKVGPKVDVYSYGIVSLSSLQCIIESPLYCLMHVYVGVSRDLHGTPSLL